MSLPEKALTILKRLAIGELGADDMSDYCLYCQGEPLYGYEGDTDSRIDFPHERECIIALAREELREQDMPLSIYKVTNEVQLGTKREKRWVPGVSYTIASCEQDVINEYTSDKVRNITMTVVRPLVEANR